MEDLCPEAGKSSWPELLWAAGEVAVGVIDGMSVTADFRCDRVRVWLNKNGVVKSVPQIG
ncbi:hypothetical protein ACS0TY_007372 [Phlomoides rotata]